MRFRKSLAAVAFAACVVGSVATAAPALACSGTSRCYGEMVALQNGVDPDEYGGTMHLKTTCIYAGYMAGGPAITNEIWVGSANDPAGNYWVEAGIVSGRPVSNFPRTSFFWADNRPTYGYAEHEIDTANTGQDYGVDIHYVGGNQWAVIRDGVTLGYSTSNSAPGRTIDVGTEDQGAAMYSKGSATSVKWRDSLQYAHTVAWESLWTEQDPPAYANTDSTNNNAFFGTTNAPC